MAQTIGNNEQAWEVIKGYSAWNRLETRPRKRDFSRTLRVEIHDPLWMLGKQWQMGEFKGEDTGSAILGRVQMDYRKISGVSKVGTTTSTGYNQEVPLEAWAEALYYNWSKKERIIMGKKWLYFLRKNITNTTLYNTYKNLFFNSSDFTYSYQEPTNTSLPADDIIQAGEIFSNYKLSTFLSNSSFAGHKIDGGVVYWTLKASSWATDLQAIFGNSLPYSTDIGAARTEYLDWVSSMYVLPDNENAEKWNQQNLEYEFNTYYPNGSSPELRLKASKYFDGHLDWHHFNQMNNSSANPTVDTKVSQVIISQSKFAGMPASRWWEFENGGMNLAKVDGNTTDLAKIIMAQFALVYHDDWFVIPFKIPVGSYSKMKGLLVTDVFGISSFVANYDVDSYSNNSGFTKEPNKWKSWRWMDTTVNTNSSVHNSEEPAGALLLPPVTIKVTESEPIESVVFIQDEISDLVWAIEKVVPDDMSNGMDGYEKANTLTKYLKDFKQELAIPTPPVVPDPEATLSYSLSSNTMPENWIPFMPVQITPGTSRQIHFQRAAMPRILDNYENTLIRPQTDLLKTGLSGYLNNPNYKPLYVNEEAIPKTGLIVNTSFQRTRWHNGKIVLWVGRSKKYGRGETTSGLTFDKVKDLNI